MSILIIVNSIIGFFTAGHLNKILNNNEKSYNSLATSSSGSSKDDEDNEITHRKPVSDN